MLVFAHAIAAARERGWRLVNPSFCEYADGFAGPAGNLAGAEAIRPQRAYTTWERAGCYAAWRLAYKPTHLLPELLPGLVMKARARRGRWHDFRAILPPAEEAGCRLLFAQGFHFRAHDWVPRHVAFIRAFLAPVAELRAPAERLARALARPGRTLVGVHIRHGDYAQHMGGAFFYPQAAYARAMRALQERIGACAFIVCSNAPQDPALFAGLDWAPGPGHLVSDLHALACCDLVFGPPSSFSAWAAWHGGARLARMRHVDHDPAPAEFVAEPWPEHAD